MLTKRLARAGCVAITCFVMTAWSAGAQGRATSKGGPSTPSMLYSNVAYPDPIWVSAAEMIKDSKQIQWELLGKNDAENWRRSVPDLNHLQTKQSIIEEVSKDKCSQLEVELTWPTVDSSIKGDFAALLKESKEVFAGTVVSRTPGFLVGAPATVLKVDVTEGLRFEENIHDHAVLYVAYPQAYFSMRGLVVCGDHQKGAHLPEVGSRILVLSHYPPMDANYSLLQVAVQEVISGPETGTLNLPPNLEDSPELQGISSFDDLLEHVRQALTDGPELTRKSGSADGGGSR